jgi:hypothetical protein
MVLRKFIIPGDDTGTARLGGHYGRIGEDVGVKLLLGVERHQLGRAGRVSRRTETH